MATELDWDDAEVAAQIDMWQRIAGVEGLVPGAAGAVAGGRVSAARPGRAGRPALMGIVNATPDSFSDRQGPKGSTSWSSGRWRLVADGAAIVDVGGESGRTDREAVSEDEESPRSSR